VYAPETNTMVAQQDEPPVGGLNPTHTWQTGEMIVSPVKVTISPTAAPGAYTLLVGLYDPAAEGARLPAQDAHGQPLPDDQIELTKLTVK
jgi:hypothetical protein